MINLLIGPPGGGKSYEAVVYHILVALNRGRKVITNLPLCLDEVELICPGARELVEFRHSDRRMVKDKAGHQSEQLVRPFAHIGHYGCDWRHAEGYGPLYVIDECHKCIPRIGTSIDVEEWFAEHRHEHADVLLITQSYGKINPAVRDSVQVLYRCRKAVALGSTTRYIRKVQDGCRGEVVNENIRTYESKYFKLYNSHTKSGAGAELGAADIKPIWHHWTFRGAAIMFVIAAGLGIKAYNHESPSSLPKVETVVIQSDQSVVYDQQSASLPARGPAQKTHPFDGKTMHLTALIVGVRTVNGAPSQFLSGYVSIESTGDLSRLISFSDLTTAGYEIKYESPSVVSMSYHGADLGFVVTDLPTAALAKSAAKQSPLEVGKAGLAAGGLPLAGGTR